MKTSFKKMPTSEIRFRYLSNMATTRRVRWIAHRRFDGTTFFN